MLDIPYTLLDVFYFETVIPRLHVALQQLATDRRILHHQPAETHISSVRQLLNKFDHLYIPWVLNDIFELDDVSVLALGEATLLIIVELVIADHAADGQLLPDPKIVLLQNQLHLYTVDKFRTLFGDNTTFWDAYQHAYQQQWDGLAQEILCVDDQRFAYTYDAMCAVNQQKTAIDRLLIDAQGRLSLHVIDHAPLHRAYEVIRLVDFLLDDAADWREDAQLGRCTLPVVMAADAAGCLLADFGPDRLLDLEDWLGRYGILVQIAELAISLLEAAQQSLMSLGYMEKTIGTVISNHLHTAQEARLSYQKNRVFQALARASRVIRP